MQKEIELIHAPFTPEQVDVLSAYQQLGITHPYTCRLRSQHEGEGILIATTQGWKCSEDKCNYTQDWALKSTADPELLNQLRDFSKSFQIRQPQLDN